jgi:hypothetical protein
MRAARYWQIDVHGGDEKGCVTKGNVGATLKGSGEPDFPRRIPQGGEPC